ncbi:MAG TPA: hypothetical protein PLU64_03580 [Saprospiraceae bacterium]|nr:hypothetical protein [Saprospiraceae bacterium]
MSVGLQKVTVNFFSWVLLINVFARVKKRRVNVSVYSHLFKKMPFLFGAWQLTAPLFWDVLKGNANLAIALSDLTAIIGNPLAARIY